MLPARPRATVEDAERIAATRYGLSARATELAAEFDRNFLLDCDTGDRYVLKVAAEGADERGLRSQLEILRYLAGTGLERLIQKVRPALDGEDLIEERIDESSTHLVRVLGYIEGHLMAHLPRVPPKLLDEIGGTLARLDLALEAFDHPGAHREHVWDLARVLDLSPFLDHIDNPKRRGLVERCLERFRVRVAPHLPGLSRSVIYNDPHVHNLLVSDLDPAAARLCGMIDFGDMVHTITVAEPAIAAAYQMLGLDDPIAAAARVISAYDAVRPLTDLERSLLWDLINARLCASVLMSSEARSREPDNEYLLISAEPVWSLLEELSMTDPDEAVNRLNDAGGAGRIRARDVDEIVQVRRRHFGPNLSISYQRPIKIVRGEGQYLFDADGKRYLDMVNNVTHVGHCHPWVAAAVKHQMSLLNTNTRYLHDNLIEYVERLVGTMPDPLSVCFLVCTGTEANDLAIRLARARTGSLEIIVVDHAYHGNSPTQIEISPYKCEGPGGQGLAPHAHKVPLPDVFRGLHRGTRAGGSYAAHVAETVAGIAATTGRMGTFMAESMIGCGGQIVPPDGYLEASYAAVREAGGVCIADEVQVGFGRVGTHMWAFELQGVVPDIVTLGKPIGNGHPLAAVVTTPEIAASFDTGMEYFNTFGGNPVSCAAGLAVLDVIEQEGLQKHALEVGDRLLNGLRELQTRHSLIGDVRGAGLFIGLELVSDRDTLEPAADEASDVIERMKDRGFLLSTDGPDLNVIKIKPPMVIQPEDVDAALEALDTVMAGISHQRE